jgi:hypothetical protein
MPPTGEYSRVAVAAPAAKPAKRRSGLGVLVALAAIGAGVAGVLYFAESQNPDLAGASAPSAAAPSATPPPAASPPSHVAAPGPAVSPTPAPVTTAELPAGAEVPPGYGYLEVSAPPGARIRVDGILVGSGPTAGTPAAPGHHEVRIEQAGREAAQIVEVVSGKTSRLRSAPSP